MYLPDQDHVMRHISYSRLEKDEDGNPIGILPQAFELKEEEKGISVNWLEYFGGTPQDNVLASVKTFRDTRKIGSKSGYGVGSVDNIQNTCNQHGARKVRILLDEEENNKSHSIIIRLPRDNLEIRQALAVEVFHELYLEKDIT